MQQLRRLVCTATLALVLALSMVGGATAVDKITFATDFGLYGRHAFFFVALEKGYYARENLDVDIVRSPGSASTVNLVASGKAQLGFADSFAVILGRGNDGVKVKLVAMIYAKGPHAIYALKNSGIKTPKDLEGKTLADTAYSSVPKIFPVYAKTVGIDPTKVKWVFATSDALPGMLANRKVDGVGQFTVGEPLLAQIAAPNEVVGFEYSSAGLDYYSNGIIASEELIQKNPDLIRRFVRATLAGLQDAIDDPKAAGAIINKWRREIEAETAAAETLKVKALAVRPGVPLGTITPDRVQKTIDLVQQAFSLKHEVKVPDVYEAGFLPK